METPVLDLEVLQKKANDAAMKGAIDAITEFYNGYNSPFKKAITQNLEERKLGINFDLPDVLALINEKLSAEIDIIANTAIYKTYIPQVKKLLTRVDTVVNFSDILKEAIAGYEINYDDDYSVDVTEESKYGWLDVDIHCKDDTISMTFHKDHNAEKVGEKKYCLLSLPRDGSKGSRYCSAPSAKIEIDGAKIEVPFTKDILANDFITYLSRLVICKSVITMDCDDFDEDMFDHND